ncbi:MAG: TIGR00266 family protein [Pseudomonadota bacterium]|jgi:uncharacterized protein (TIGR00266 family)
MTAWYLSYHGQQLGPFDLSVASAKARENRNGYAWREGFSDWMPIAQVAELGAGQPRAAATPPSIAHLTSDVIDFKIGGAEMQFVEVELDPGESVIAEAGSMMYKDSTVVMESVFGDAKGPQSSVVDKLIGAGKRLITGEGLFLTVFTHKGQGKAHAAFAAPYPGNIVPVALNRVGGTLICQKDSFLCAAKGVAVGVFFQRRILTGLFGGEGFLMQKLEGDGLVFMHAGGTVVERQLVEGEELHVDTGCLVGFLPSIDFSLQQVGGVKSALFGGEGLFFARLRGPGTVWLQSLPFSRVAGRMLAAAPGSKEEGSVLGKIGALVQGD